MAQFGDDRPTTSDTRRRKKEKKDLNDSGNRLLQEAQLPLRNRASAMHFFVAKLFSITVMTYNCV